MKSRATKPEELDAIMDRLFTLESRQRGLAFRPRPSDVIISPYAKSGTTWLQQIVHGLRTSGSMDFDEITAVTPWIEVAYDVGWDLEAEQVSQPRVFKSHLSYHDIPKGGRYIISFRNPRDALVSFFRFFEGWFFEPGSISLEELARWRWPRGEVDNSGYWYHLISWWEQRHNENVLLLSFEDMKADLPGTVEKIARFLGIELDDRLFDIVVRQSSKEFMLAHVEYFNESYTRRLGEQQAGLPPNGNSNKVTPGALNKAHYKLSPALERELEDIWQEQVQARYGFRDYEELRLALKRLHYSNGNGLKKFD